MSTTVKELLDQGSQSLNQAGIENARHAVELMLGAILNLRRIDLFFDLNRLVAEVDAKRFTEMVGRKLYREPLQYILGSTEWFGLSFKCDRRALIPRPETEIILESALAAIAETRAPRIADIGTGTGCIAIAAAVNRSDAAVVATDLSPTALQLAQENITAHGLAHRVLLRPGELLDPLGTETFDLIVSNPPYVRGSELPHLMPEVRDFEPRNALVAGEDGLECLRPLIERSARNLTAGGILAVEFGVDHAAAVFSIAQGTGAFDLPRLIVDYSGHDRGVILKKR